MTLPYDTLLRCYDVPRGTVEAWLKETRERGIGFGHELAMRLTIEGNVTAEKLLRALEKAGRIERVTWAPSQHQRFFGVGGLTMQTLERSQDARDFHLECWSWRVVDAGVAIPDGGCQ